MFFHSLDWKSEGLAGRISLELNTQNFEDYLIDLTDIRLK